MLVKLQLNKNTLSSWILAIFALTLILGGFGSEFFQAPISTTEELEKYRQLFKDNFIQKAQEIEVKNKLGSYTLVNEGRWTLKSPRVFDAKQVTVERIFSTLNNLKIKKIFPKDTINIQNFTLDTPSLQITLKSQDESKTISFGLVNPIDNSTYVTLEDVDAIYHLDSTAQALEKLTLSDFIDSRIFAFDISEIQKVAIKRDKRTRLELTKKEEGWFAPKGRVQDEKVQNYLSDLVRVKSSIILDKRDEKLDERLNRYLERPLYTIEVQNSNNETMTYELSYIINSLPGIKMDKKENFIIRASNRKHPFLVNKNNMKTFNKTQRSFPPLNIKKLFY